MEDTRVRRARVIIKKIHYLTIATTTKGGQPWNSPVFSAYDGKYNFFWASDQNSQHSKNIEENNEVFIAIYDSTVAEGAGKGVYIQAKAYQLTGKKEIAHALKYLDGRVNKKPHSPTQFLGDMPRRVYKAVPDRVWVNEAGEAHGNYIDVRVEVNLARRAS